MTPADDGPGRGSVSRLPAVRAAGAAPPTPIEGQRMERMIDAVQALSRQLTETQRTLQVFAEQLTAMAEDLTVPSATPVAPVVPTAAVRPAVGVPVRRPAPPAPEDPGARDRPPSALHGHVLTRDDGRRPTGAA